MTTSPFPPRTATSRTAFAVAAACLMLAAPLRAANPEYFSLAGVPIDGFQKWMDDAREKGFQTVYINGYDAGDHVEFAGVAVKDDLPWEARYNLTAGELQKAIDEYKAKGLRPNTVSGYLSPGKKPRFTATWVKDNGNVQWDIRHNITHMDYIKELRATRENGLRPQMVSGYADPDGEIHFTTLFVRVRDKDEVWDSPHDMTEAKFQEKLDQWREKGLRPTDISVYETADGPRFTAVGLQWDSSGRIKDWTARHGLTGAEYQKQFNKLGEKGFRPIAICGYLDGGEVRYAAVWNKGK